MLRSFAVLAAFAPFLGACGPAAVNFGETGTGPLDSDPDSAPDSDSPPDDTAALVATLGLSASSLDLGFAGGDEPVSATLVAGSVGTGTLDLQASIDDGDTHYAVDVTQASLEPGDSVVLTVSFSASEMGTYGGTLVLVTNDPDQLSVTIPLTVSVSIDEDGDGYVLGDDCDDEIATTYPGAPDEPYDDVDSDCSETSDFDADGDGHDSDDYGGDDCNDENADVHPGAEETWYDDLDQDCDGRSDNDADGDGHDSETYGGDDCDDDNAEAYVGNLETEDNGIDDDCDGLVDDTPETTDSDGDGFSEATGDCDDTDADISPAADEIWYDGIDSDCAGDNDYDQDGDGYDVDTSGGDDCDDTAAATHPGATDAPYDGVDKNCDGASDNDADGDGYDSVSYGGDDCNDGNAAVNPGAAEIWYDGADQDCSGGSDYDQDGDGNVSADYAGNDCDDLDPTVYFGAPETWYDGLDADCDGLSDYDQDKDGYDSDAWGGDDCNDLVSAISPGAIETWYDGVDRDCSGGSDYDQDGDGYDDAIFGGEDCDDLDPDANPGAAETWYDGVDSDCAGDGDFDQDGDGFDVGTLDCDDTESAVNVAAIEICDGLDNDCDGLTDDISATWYEDNDGDGYGNSAVSVVSCVAPSGFVADATDCDDAATTTNPGAAEIAYDAIDNDCDGMPDDMDAVDVSDWTVIGTSTSHALGATAPRMFDDVDGNGDAELIFGVPTDDVGDTDAGALAWHDLGDRGTEVDVTDGYLHIYGESAFDGLGTGLGSLGDLDYDSGEIEFVVGAAGDDDGAIGAGAVYIFDTYSDDSWQTGDENIDDLSQVKLIGTSGSEAFGAEVATGDVDGDGAVDILVGGVGKSSSRGSVFVYLASYFYWYDGYLNDDSDATATVRGTASGDEFGSAIVTGDVDGDGDDDVVACATEWDVSRATTSAGGCWLVDPDSVAAFSTSTVTSVDSAQIYGVASGDGVGTPGTLAMADVDGDGLLDLAVGVPGYDGGETNGGMVAVFFARTMTGSISVEAADTRIEGDGGCGTAVSLGDINRSTIDGLLVGAPTAGTAGVVYALTGKQVQSGGVLIASESAYGSWRGEASSDGFGSSLSNVYDIDDDGLLDFAAGADEWDDGTTLAAGKAYVLPLW